ncbi:MAG TPA: YciC family protein [Dongiaceae bacterium]|jgi:hypothetical protein
MKSYLKEMSIGEVIDGSVRLYFRNFVTIFLIYLVPLFIAEIIVIGLWPYGNPSEPADQVLVLLLRLAAAVPASAATTVAVSEIALGQKPRVTRAYGRVFDVLGRFLWTYLLVMLIFIVGFALLVVPGVIAMVLLMFATVAVILERRGGLDALKRSIQLGKGYYLRNLGAFLLTMALIYIVDLVIGFLLAFLVLAFDDIQQPGIVVRLVFAVFSNLFTPIILITTALLYYDLRVRKENYDTATLAQDLVG